MTGPTTPTPHAAPPDFVGIGALKAGTTFLDGLLRGHPQLSLPRFLKEADYFSRHWERGPQWYADLFAPADGRLRGELSPQYMSSPDAPDRLQQANASARVIANLRHPVNRTVSQYRHWVQETGYAGDFPTFVAEHPNAVDRSEYHRLLGPWLERFGSTGVHLVVFEDLIAEPVATSQAVMRFLGVDDTFVPADPDTPVNATFNPRFPRAYTLAKRAGDRLRSGRGARVVDLVKRKGLNTVLMSATDGRPAPSVSEEDRARLSSRLRPDAERLSALMDRDLVAFWGL